MAFVVSLVFIVAGIVCFFALKTPKASKWIASGLTAFGLIVLAFTCVTSVPTGHTGVVTTFGKVEEYTFEAGIHLKSPVSEVTYMDNRTQKGTLQMSCFSSDIQEVSVTYTINYQIQKQNAQTIYRNIGQDYYNTVVTPCIQESLKTIAAQYSAENLIGSRAKMAQQVEENLANQLAKYNVDLVSAAIEDMDFTDAFTNAVEEKQVAAQNKLKAETQAEQKIVEAKAEAEQKLIQARAEAEAKLIAADAEAEANKKIAASLTDAVLYQQWLETWDGKLPTVAGSDANVIIDSLSGSENKN